MGGNKTDVDVTKVSPPIATLSDKYAQAQLALRDLLNFFDHPDIGQWTPTDISRLKEIREIAGQTEQAPAVEATPVSGE
jgi:hypothetical protein